MKDIYKDLIFLLACAVNNIKPDIERVQGMDLDKIYNIAKYHNVTSTIGILLEEVNIKEEKFNQACKKTIRKNIMLDMERTKILDEFEKEQIWYLPLKGIILKEMYPKSCMREMADNDILFDKEKQKDVKKIMLSHGYTAKAFGISNHDVYTKPPVYNFELHTDLFGTHSAESIYEYYKDVKKILEKDNNNDYGFHFSDEDFYVYITAHEWKHYNGNGTGLRSLLDCYIYIKNKGDSLSFEYIDKQTKKLGIFDFEKNRRKLAVKVFSSDLFPILNEEETNMLIYYLTSGTYGTLENNIRKKLKKQGKLLFVINTIFISYKSMTYSVPFTKKSILLYPIGFIWRCFRMLFLQRKKLKTTIREVKKYGK